MTENAGPRWSAPPEAPVPPGPFPPSPQFPPASGVPRSPPSSAVPAPPAGPGVQPPFAAPPSEGRTARVWWGLGVAGLAVVLCCGVGLAAVVGLVVTGTAAINEQAHTAVEDYLQAVGAGRYSRAYNLLCDELRDRQSLNEFTAQVSVQPKVREYELLQTRMRNNGDVVVPANVTYTNGAQSAVNYRLAQDRGTIRFCGTTG
jgi:hypothetical protein